MSKKLLKRLICLFAAACLLLFGTAVSAESSQGVITVSTVKAATGSSVIINLDMSNNPGIMAMTISITYDSEALTYERYYDGYLNDILIEDHPDKNLLRLVSCERMNRKNNDTIVSLQFKVNDNASFDKHTISIDYKSGDFCNWMLERLNPQIIPGGVEVEFNGKNCSHSEYGEWEVAANPTCRSPGAMQRFCLKCGTAEIKEIPSAGHVFSEEWIVDRPATAELSGIMSRHCNNCDEVTDVIYFELEDAEELGIDNTENTYVPPSDKTEEFIEEHKTESGSGSSSAADKTENETAEETTGNTASDKTEHTGIGKGIDKSNVLLFTAIGGGIILAVLAACLIYKLYKNRRT